MSIRGWECEFVGQAGRECEGVEKCWYCEAVGRGRGRGVRLQVEPLWVYSTHLTIQFKLLTLEWDNGWLKLFQILDFFHFELERSQ